MHLTQIRPDTNQELQPNCDIFIYFRNKKTTGGAGSCDFFLGSPSPQDSFKRYMGFHGLQRWMNPNGPLDEFRFFVDKCGRSLWWWYLDFQRWAHTSPFSLQVEILSLFRPRSKVFWVGKVWFVGTMNEWLRANRIEHVIIDRQTIFVVGNRMNSSVGWMLNWFEGLNAFCCFLSNARKGHATYGPSVSRRMGTFGMPCILKHLDLHWMRLTTIGASSDIKPLFLAHEFVYTFVNCTLFCVHTSTYYLAGQPLSNLAICA